MIIGINASSVLKKNPTGVEEYTFQLIKHLAVIPEARYHRFVLYLNSRLKSERLKELEALPDNFEIKFLSFPFLWTQARLACEMFFSKIDTLFIPVHILPFIHPKNSIVAIHGLEYEYFPELYPFWHRIYLRWSTKYAIHNAAKIIAVSENTKKDLVRLYGGNPDKISVIHHGINQSQATCLSLPFDSIQGKREHKKATCGEEFEPSCDLCNSNYILYIGRIEIKKNVLGIIIAYNILRQKNSKISNKLVLAGGRGFGFEKIKKAVEASPFRNDIILKGYISESEKNYLWKNSALFIFPSFYEGFGMPVLEAQAQGVPVINSNTSCLPEIAGKGAIFIDPKSSADIAQAMEKILSLEELRQNLIKAGLENVKRFSWEKCARETLKILTG